jgi:hypothetical protein
MHFRGSSLFLSVVVIALGAAPASPAQRISDKEAERIIERLEKSSDRFESSFDDAVDDAALDSEARRSAKRFVEDFESATDHLKKEYDDEHGASAAAEGVLRAGAAIQDFMMAHSLNARAQEDWRALRMGLDDLARAYGVSWTWSSAHRLSHDEMKELLERIEKRSDTFRSSLDAALDRSRLDDTAAEKLINRYVKDFEDGTDRLKDRYRDEDSASEFALQVLRHGANIEQFMRRNPLNAGVQSDWAALRSELDTLARSYNITFEWPSSSLLVR